METHQKVIENDQAKILQDFQIQTDKIVKANRPNTVVLDKKKKAIVKPSDRDIREKIERQGLMEEMEKCRGGSKGGTWNTQGCDSWKSGSSRC